MAILIDVRQDKRKNSNHLYYGHAWNPTILTTRDLAKRIQANVSVKESDVYAVLIELAEVMTYELANSNKVQLDRFGYFYPSITSTGSLQKDDWNVAENVKDCRIKFTTFYTRSAANAAEGKASGLSSRALSNGFQFVVKNLEAKPTEEPDPGE